MALGFGRQTLPALFGVRFYATFLWGRRKQTLRLEKERTAKHKVGPKEHLSLVSTGASLMSD
jgi:hypothetical protein